MRHGCDFRLGEGADPRPERAHHAHDQPSVLAARYRIEPRHRPLPAGSRIRYDGTLIQSARNVPTWLRGWLRLQSTPSARSSCWSFVAGPG
jgi:hypothetical protein